MQLKEFQLIHEAQCCSPSALVNSIPVTGAVSPKLGETHEVVSWPSMRIQHKDTEFVSGQPGLKSQLCHFLTM